MPDTSIRIAWYQAKILDWATRAQLFFLHVSINCRLGSETWSREIKMCCRCWTCPGPRMWQILGSRTWFFHQTSSAKPSRSTSATLEQGQAKSPRFYRFVEFKQNNYFVNSPNDVWRPLKPRPCNLGYPDMKPWGDSFNDHFNSTNL